MSKEWDGYFTDIDDKPAAVFVDMGIADDAPLARLAVVAWVKLRMLQPGADGLASDQETATLNAIAEALKAGLIWKSTAYVGCVTTDGREDFYFYTSAAQGWKEQVAGVLAVFPDYQYSCGSRPDREWDIYFDLLSPGDEDLERIQNRRICDALKNGGDRLDRARAIEHTAYFPDANSRDKFIRDVSALGYTVIEMIEPEDRGEQFGVRISGTGIPSHQNIDALTLPLYRAATDYGGEYEGWETEVVR